MCVNSVHGKPSCEREERGGERAGWAAPQTVEVGYGAGGVVGDSYVYAHWGYGFVTAVWAPYVVNCLSCLVVMFGPLAYMLNHHVVRVVWDRGGWEKPMGGGKDGLATSRPSHR